MVKKGHPSKTSEFLYVQCLFVFIWFICMVMIISFGDKQFRSIHIFLVIFFCTFIPSKGETSLMMLPLCLRPVLKNIQALISFFRIPFAVLYFLVPVFNKFIC